MNFGVVLLSFFRVLKILLEKSKVVDTKELNAKNFGLYLISSNKKFSELLRTDNIYSILSLHNHL